MKDFATVKFEVSGETHYGNVASPFDPEAKEVTEEGLILVEDYVYPARYALPESALTEVDYEEANAYQKAKFQEALALSKSVRGCAPGKLISFSVADGYAHYVVTKVTAKKVTIEWRAFYDDYMEPILMWGGKFDRTLIEPHVLMEEKMEELGFG